MDVFLDVFLDVDGCEISIAFVLGSPGLRDAAVSSNVAGKFLNSMEVRWENH